MALEISWTDTLRSLMPTQCFPSTSRHLNRHSSNPDLDALLSSSTNSSTDALSLHSTHRPHVRRTHKSANDRMTLCGLEVFGRRGRIALPEDDENEPSQPRTRTTSTTSGGTYDSDAAPLDASPTLAELQAKEERRRLRRERKQRKQRRAERDLLDADEFEGFQGSGPLHDYASSPPSSPYPFDTEPQPLPPPPAGYTYVQAPDGAIYLQAQVPVPENLDDEDDADLDGAIFARSSSSKSVGGSGGSSSSGRSPRSPGSSQYNPIPQPHQLLPTHAMHLPPKKKKKSSRTSRSSATSSTLAESPVASTFPK